MHAELVFTLIESDRELATSEIIVKTNSAHLDCQLSRHTHTQVHSYFGLQLPIYLFKCLTYFILVGVVISALLESVYSGPSL